MFISLSFLPSRSFYGFIDEKSDWEHQLFVVSFIPSLFWIESLCLFNELQMLRVDSAGQIVLVNKWFRFCCCYGSYVCVACWSGNTYFFRLLYVYVGKLALSTSVNIFFLFFNLCQVFIVSVKPLWACLYVLIRGI